MVNDQHVDEGTTITLFDTQGDGTAFDNTFGNFQQYEFKIRAQNPVGYSAWSTAASHYFLAAPGLPTSVVRRTGGTNTGAAIALQWTEPTTYGAGGFSFQADGTIAPINAGSIAAGTNKFLVGVTPDAGVTSYSGAVITKIITTGGLTWFEATGYNGDLSDASFFCGTTAGASGEVCADAHFTVSNYINFLHYIVTVGTTHAIATGDDAQAAGTKATCINAGTGTCTIALLNYFDDAGTVGDTADDDTAAAFIAGDLYYIAITTYNAG